MFYGNVSRAFTRTLDFLKGIHVIHDINARLPLEFVDTKDKLGVPFHHRKSIVKLLVKNNRLRPRPRARGITVLM
jgi:hypothetical protein